MFSSRLPCVCTTLALMQKTADIITVFFETQADTEAFARRVAQALLAHESDIAQHGFNLRLNGGLGAGKTTFTRALLRACGVTGRVRSPTFELVEDYEIRKDLKKRLYDAGVPAIEIERKNDEIKIMIQCARPGMVVGRGGEDIKKLEEELTKKYGKKVRCSIIEIKNPDTNATLVAENIAAQLEKRIGFRRAMKQCMGRAMRMGAKGIKVSCGGRLGGAEIARTEHYHEGTIPLQTLRADIDYGFAEAATTYGRIGVKVWIYKGEILNNKKAKGGN